MTLFSSRYARIGLSFCLGLNAVPALAQTQEAAPAPAAPLAEQWQKLQEASSRITACHVVWKRVMRTAPMPEADPKKWADNALAQARKRGETEVRAQRLAEIERHEALTSQKGRVINSTLDFVRVGHSVLCRSSYTDPAYKGLRTLEFSDGRASLDTTLNFQGKAVEHLNGNVTGNPQEMMRTSRGGFQGLRFLVGIPLDQSFGPQVPALSGQNAALKVRPDGTLLAEREARMENRRTTNPDEITFAKDTFTPLSAASFGLAGRLADGKITLTKYKAHSQIVASDYKQYANGTWFPSKVVSTYGRTTIEYTLVEAHFNEEVDPACYCCLKCACTMTD